MPLSHQAQLSPEGDGFHPLGNPSQFTTTVSPTRSFTLFSELPTELRLKIWQYTLPAPRTVKVDYGKERKSLRSNYPPPIALHICSESRGIAIKYYEPAFSNSTRPTHTYFDFEKDVLMFHGYTFDCLPDEETIKSIGHDLARVRFIACSAARNITNESCLPYFRDLTAFKSLEEIIVLVRPAVEGGPEKKFVEVSSIPLDGGYRLKALRYMERVGQAIIRIADLENLSPSKFRIMTYIGQEYRRY